MLLSGWSRSIARRSLQSDTPCSISIARATFHSKGIRSWIGALAAPLFRRSKDERASGVRQWQEDVWKAIIKSLRSSSPLEVRLDWREELKRPAVTQYSAAT